MDFIIIDNDKHRKTIPRLSIVFDNDFYSLTIYNQIGVKMDLDYDETFHFKIKPNNIITKNSFYYSYIGGFLSRYLFNKSYRVCFYAGCLLIKKLYKYYKKGANITNIDDYNILVPNKHNSLKQKIIQLNNKLMKENENKEKGFILDCMNLNNCKIKTYNPLFDNNCASYLLKKNNLKLLQKNGFISKKGMILKDPSFSLNLKKSRLKKNTIKTNLANLNFCNSLSFENKADDSVKIKYKTINNLRHCKKINESKKKFLPLLSNANSSYKIQTSRENNHINNIKSNKENNYYKHLFGIYQPNCKFNNLIKKK